MDWNYLRVLDKVRPYLLFDEISSGIFEAVVLDGLPTKTLSNSDDPPNSFRTRDTWTKHPNRDGLWKYLGRLDDRITLFNGEKVLPIPFEHIVRQNEIVHDCVMFGVGKAFPGLMVFLNQSAQEIPHERVLDILWPAIQRANEQSEQFGRVSREMVKIMPAGTVYPRTDKGTVIRAACYKQFENEIEEAYDMFETSGSTEKLHLEVPALKEYLTELLTEILGSPLSDEDDFFAASMDSLQSITSRAKVVREISVGEHKLGGNVVFDYPTVSKLAEYLHALRIGSTLESQSEEDIMRQLLQKYSKFESFKPGTQSPAGEVVVSTCYPSVQITWTNRVSLASDRSDRIIRRPYSGSITTASSHTACLLPSAGFCVITRVRSAPRFGLACRSRPVASSKRLPSTHFILVEREGSQ